MDISSEGVDSVHKLCNVWSDSLINNVSGNSSPSPELHYVINEWSLRVLRTYGYMRMNVYFTGVSENTGHQISAEQSV